MGQITLSGNPPIEVNLRRSSRARRMTLRLSQLDGKVTLTLPLQTPDREARAFVADKEAWLRGHLAGYAPPVRIGLGARLPIEGVMMQVRAGSGRRVRIEAGAILVPGPAEQASARLAGHIKSLARDRLAAASDHYADCLGRRYSKLTLRDTRSRWGSCSSDGGLMYSWRLVMAPPEVLTYVAAHEVAHLVEMNHSSAFWRVVTDLYGPWQAQRDWLKIHGAGLHRYRFGD